jgi:poly-gamma-glutamate capsule biosynthesis protein CapA/YwtB (metallophosphatase superfamily)
VQPPGAPDRTGARRGRLLPPRGAATRRAAAAAAVLLTLAGCGGDPPERPRPVPTLAAGRTTPAPTTPSPTPAPPPTVTVGWSGDAVPASVDRGLPPDPGRLLRAVTPILRRPDVMVGNLEGTLTRVPTSTKCAPDSEDCVAFRSPPGYARLFADAGYDVLSLANNHSHDFGPAGLAETRAAVRGAGLETTGGPDEIAVRTVRGIRVAVVGFAPYGWAAPLNAPAAVRELVGRAAAAADVVVVVFHGGAEGPDALHVPAGRETAFGEDRGDLREFARTAVAAGADAVLGAGPHVVRGAEVVGGRPVAYSVGNLVGYRTLSSAGVTGTTAVLHLTFGADGRWVAGRLLPTRQVPPGYAEPDPERAAIALVARLSREDFGPTAARVDAQGRILPPG